MFANLLRTLENVASSKPNQVPAEAAPKVAVRPETLPTATPNPAPTHRSFAQKIATATGIVILFVLLMIFLWASRPILMLGFGCILFAVILRAMARLLRKRIPQIPTQWAVGLATVLLIGLLVAFFIYAAPTISSEFASLTEQIPEALQKVESTLNESRLGRIVLENIQALQGSGSFSQLTGIVGGVLGAITHTVVIIVGGLFLALNPRLYVNGLLKLFPISSRKRGFEVICQVITKLEGWLLGQFIAMLSVGVLTWIGLEILGVPLALILGVIIFIFDFVPFIGPFLGAIPGILVAFSYDPSLVLYVGLVYLVVQNIESYLVVPLVQQKTIAVPPVLLMLVALLGGVLLGIPGTIIATPALVVVMTLVKEIYIKDILKDPHA
ncbi:AI-2E family transporter [Rhabdobacter roseus]|uniref:Putative PurR-regulated permease PerM n=1 Tax=Rhabdobacter roseus TaxID=1655419 RepID=A0A840TIT6_9BACT|nr:AI-2E family transporter [Rhabdobacter roseus]MBB5284096.1 putative PurR-regulated permease PerM [Rhabdobacter roseus]